MLLEDDLLLGKRIEAYLANLGLEITRVETCAHAQRALQAMFFDFALFDLNLPDGDSLNLLKSGYIPDNTLCILMTGEGGVKSAVESIRLGAADYLSKPFDVEELPLVFNQAQSNRKNKRLVEHVTKKNKERIEHLFFEGSFAADLREYFQPPKRAPAKLPPFGVHPSTR